MLKDIIKEQKLKMNEKYGYSQGQGQIITETAQIVAREVLRKVREGYGDEREFEIQPDGEYHFGANQKVIGWNKARLAYLTYLQSLENELSEVLSK
jgi:hypothetical protein